MSTRARHEGTQTDEVHIPCHHEHLARPESLKKFQAASSALSAVRPPKDTQTSPQRTVVSPTLARGHRQYILQHSPQRVGVMSVGMRTLSSLPTAATGSSKSSDGKSSPASKWQPPATKLEPKALRHQQHKVALKQSGASAEATAWLNVVRDDAKSLEGILPHVSVNLADDEGETLLLCACRCSSSMCALLLIERGAACDARDEDGLLALCWACKNSLAEVIESLWRKHGSAAAPNDGDAALALQCACSSSKPGVAVTALLSVMCGNCGEGAANQPSLQPMLDALDPDTSLPAVFAACLRGCASSVEQICQAGANVQHVDATGRNLYHYLATYIAKLHPHTILVAAAASCGRPTRYQPGTKYVVVRAPHGNEMFIPKEHLKRQLYCRDNQGDTPLHTSIQQLRPCAVASFLLLASEKILTTQNKLGMNPLHELTVLARAPISRLDQRPYFDIIQHLCRPSGPLVAACMQHDTAGKTPLHLACELPSKGVLHAMLGALLAHAPDHSVWSYDAAIQSSDLRDEICAFVGGAETSLQASRSVASQTTLRGCWCCTRCKNCLSGRPCVDGSK